jgi:AraC-like DNA-binding protein
MKALFEDIESKKGNHSFLAYSLTLPSFEFKWHYHPEYELTLITKGNGRRLVGDSYENYEAGDLVLLGPGLPHTWVTNPGMKTKASAVVIQFSEKFIHSFLQHPEFSAIASLLSASARGLYFASKNLADEIKRLPDTKGVEKITGLISILQKLTEQKPKKLTSEYFNAVRGRENEKRINVICRYVQKHSSENIELERAAELVHLSRSAFCKFFKRVTGKTFTDYVNDIRIGNACQLLIESDKLVSEIAYEIGFQNLAYFNRVFIKKKQATPRQFREKAIGS